MIEISINYAGAVTVRIQYDQFPNSCSLCFQSVVILMDVAYLALFFRTMKINYLSRKTIK